MNRFSPNLMQYKIMLIKLIQIKIVFTQYDNDKAKHTNADLSNLYPFHYRAGWIQPLTDLIHITIPYWCRHNAKYIMILSEMVKG